VLSKLTLEVPSCSSIILDFRFVAALVGDSKVEDPTLGSMVGLRVPLSLVREEVRIAGVMGSGV